MNITGPFAQLVTLSGLPMRGKISDDQLEIKQNAGIVTDEYGVIVTTGNFADLQKSYPDALVNEICGVKTALPAFVDAHTHICYGGNRANDFAMRNAGKSYLDIAESGGGIWSSVQHTRAASEDELLQSLLKRIEELVSQGITTIEIKSGYGLTASHELKMLRVIQTAKNYTKATLVPTCLAAHLKPKDFSGSNAEYLSYVFNEILLEIREEDLTRRVDIFIEKSAFQPEESKEFLLRTKSLGFEITVHADQFTPGSSRVAVDVGALSADHLEATTEEDIQYLANSETVATALPGASLGLGEPFTPARKLLDAGAILAIASDWNPGSAPMGNLVTQASILAAYEKLTTAEVLAGITFRAAKALNLQDRGTLDSGNKGDFIVYDTDNFQNILYRQGTLKPEAVYINGEKV